MMVNRKEPKSNRIPVHFVDDDKAAKAERSDEGGETVEARSNEGELSPEEIGRGSSYEDETEAQRRIDRGQERDEGGGRERADDSDTAGGPPRGDMPERREDKDQAAPNAETTGREAAPSHQGIDPHATGP